MTLRESCKSTLLLVAIAYTTWQVLRGAHVGGAYASEDVPVARGGRRGRMSDVAPERCFLHQKLSQIPNIPSLTSVPDPKGGCKYHLIGLAEDSDHKKADWSVYCGFGSQEVTPGKITSCGAFVPAERCREGRKRCYSSQISFCYTEKGTKSPAEGSVLKDGAGEGQEHHVCHTGSQRRKRSNKICIVEELHRLLEDFEERDNLGITLQSRKLPRLFQRGMWKGTQFLSFTGSFMWFLHILKTEQIMRDPFTGSMQPKTSDIGSELEEGESSANRSEEFGEQRATAAHKVQQIDGRRAGQGARGKGKGSVRARGQRTPGASNNEIKVPGDVGMVHKYPEAWSEQRTQRGVNPGAGIKFPVGQVNRQQREREGELGRAAQYSAGANGDGSVDLYHRRFEVIGGIGYVDKTKWRVIVKSQSFKGCCGQRGADVVEEKEY
ncbi:hypothetical protein K438DRAFT_1779962 [Mycena galopus ATCC 62051]|nr:hypothetical protein K438DRAFT_1779962 [Mycena galopus ATCC 62051]